MAKKETMKGKTDAELGKLITETREALRNHRNEAAASRPKNPGAGKQLKKTIARILTERTARSAK